jgi:RND superfamily putative drug exporter
VRSDPVEEAIGRLESSLEADGRYGPATLRVSETGDVGVLSVALAGDPEGEPAKEAVNDLRDRFIPAAFSGVEAEVVVTGTTAEAVDAGEIASRWMPIVIALVLGLSFVLLTITFRSLVVPLKAIVLNLLSVGAAYGLMVLVFQKGYGADLLGFQKVETVESWVPLFLFSVLFGLSMDYHVFLLTRIRERFGVTGDNTEAVAYGVGSTARLITGAALIMVAVFTGFAIGDLVMFQQMGFGLAVALILDATIVRSVLVPASMKLLGERNWYLPSWLQWLPHLDAEGPPGEPRPAAPTRAR